MKSTYRYFAYAASGIGALCAFQIIRPIDVNSNLPALHGTETTQVERIRAALSLARSRETACLEEGRPETVCHCISVNLPPDRTYQEYESIRQHGRRQTVGSTKMSVTPASGRALNLVMLRCESPASIAQDNITKGTGTYFASKTVHLTKVMIF